MNSVDHDTVVEQARNIGYLNTPVPDLTMPLAFGRFMDLSVSNVVASWPGLQFRVFGVTGESRFECAVDLQPLTYEEMVNRSVKNEDELIRSVQARQIEPTHMHLNPIARRSQYSSVTERDNADFVESLLEILKLAAESRGVEDISAMVWDGSPDLNTFIQAGFTIVENPNIPDAYIHRTIHNTKSTWLLVRYTVPKAAAHTAKAE